MEEITQEQICVGDFLILETGNLSRDVLVNGEDRFLEIGEPTRRQFRLVEVSSGKGYWLSSKGFGSGDFTLNRDGLRIFRAGRYSDLFPAD